MGNKYPQTNEAKERFESPLLNYMINSYAYVSIDYYFKKSELMAVTGWSERKVRKELERIANYYPVISISSKKGYRVGQFNDSEDEEPTECLEELLEQTRHAINDLESRVKSLNARMKPLIALKVKLEEKIIERKGPYVEVDDDIVVIPDTVE